VRLTRNTTQDSGHAGRSYRRSATIAAATILAIGAFAGTAAAMLTGSTGGSQISMDNRGDDAPSATSNMVWTNVPGAEVVLNNAHVINARFTAESTCNGPASGGCVVRIIADNGAIVDLDPSSGTDFSFDTDLPGAGEVDAREGHAMERSRHLEGAYSIRVQYAVTNAATTFTLDDWHFAVENSQ
jgi:hypothetical protein